MELMETADLKRALSEAGYEMKRGSTVLLYTGHYRRAFGTRWVQRYAPTINKRGWPHLTSLNLRIGHRTGDHYLPAYINGADGKILRRVNSD
jgi:hypothetical protein